MLGEEAGSQGPMGSAQPGLARTARLASRAGPSWTGGGRRAASAGSGAAPGRTPRARCLAKPRSSSPLGPGLPTHSPFPCPRVGRCWPLPKEGGGVARPHPPRAGTRAPLLRAPSTARETLRPGHRGRRCAETPSPTAAPGLSRGGRGGAARTPCPAHWPAPPAASRAPPAPARPPPALRAAAHPRPAPSPAPRSAPVCAPLPRWVARP